MKKNFRSEKGVQIVSLGAEVPTVILCGEVLNVPLSKEELEVPLAPEVPTSVEVEVAALAAVKGPKLLLGKKTVKPKQPLGHLAQPKLPSLSSQKLL